MYGRYDDNELLSYKTEHGLADDIPEPLECWTLDEVNDILPNGGEPI